MQSIYIDTEREDKNHISEVFVALQEHCEKIKKCESVLVLVLIGGYQFRLRRQQGLRNRRRIDARTQRSNAMSSAGVSISSRAAW
jgi:hypothetical protein